MDTNITESSISSEDMKLNITQFSGFFHKMNTLLKFRQIMLADLLLVNAIPL
jgi:hypothetical protein